MIDSKAIADEIFGFHAQQAVEKLLKALLSHQEVRYGRVHDLRVLMDLLANAKLGLPEDLQVIDVLTPYGVTLRYETQTIVAPLDRKTIRDLVRKTRAWVENKLA